VPVGRLGRAWQGEPVGGPGRSASAERACRRIGAFGLGRASLSADRATCFPRDRASCPHARRSAPASLPQVGPHRRGSPTRHRARVCSTPRPHVRVAAGCSRSRPAGNDPRRARGPWGSQEAHTTCAVRRLRSGTRSRRRPRPRGPRRQARPARSAPWPTKAGALVEVASLSTDRATCFPRDRASCPHARRSAPASLPQVGPHRRGSPTRHRARVCSTPRPHVRVAAGCSRSRPAGNDPRRARGPWGSQEAHTMCAVRRLRSGTRSRRRPRPRGPRRQARPERSAPWTTRAGAPGTRQART
jgi:hypothetical protein